MDFIYGQTNRIAVEVYQNRQVLSYFWETAPQKSYFPEN